jgi:hypothetical protein
MNSHFPTQDQFRSVAPSEPIIRQIFQLLTVGRSQGANFCAEIVGLLTERVRRILKIHPEFEKLSDTDQNVLWKRNFKKSAMIVVIRWRCHKKLFCP